MLNFSKTLWLVSKISSCYEFVGITDSQNLQYGSKYRNSRRYSSLVQLFFFNQGKYLIEKLSVTIEDFFMQDYFCVTGATNHSATFPQKACWQK